MKIIKMLLSGFVAYLNIIVVLTYIKTPIGFSETTVGFSVICAVFFLNISLEEYNKL